MARLELRLLGPFSVLYDGMPITTFESVKVRALLAYLAAEAPRPQPRERLAGLLWPDWPQRSAMNNLRYALADLRKNLHDREAQSPFLLISREAIQKNLESDVWIDVDEFERPTTNQNSLERRSNAAGTLPYKDSKISAIALYRGEFLEGFSLSDSPAFEEWILAKRAYFKRQALKLLHDLAAEARQCDDCEEALDYTRHQLELEPWNEETHREIMFLLAVLGHRSEALTQYETCRRVLKNELGVDPGIETIQLYEKIRDGKLDFLTGIPALTQKPLRTFQPSDFLEEKADSVRAPVFVAREPELSKLGGFLQEMLKGSGKVVFVTGDAGQGKTALINEFARGAMAAYPALLVASGNCNAYSGSGDPYLPFRDVMAMLTGDVEIRWAAGSIDRDHALRLWEAHSLAVQAVLTDGSSLVDTILSRDALISRFRTVVPNSLYWLERLDALSRERRTGAIELEQRLLFEQYTSVLRILADQHPLVLLLDDMQWADNASINLLFHLGRRLADCKILIVCAYRPGEVALGRLGERHPLAKVLSELKRIFGDVWVDLSRLNPAESRRFVDALLDAEPNRLEEDFRAALFHHTEGHPLFTIELLRAMQARGSLVKDDAGLWFTAPMLDWDQLPARVEAVIEERIDQLDRELQQIITVASVEGEIFTAQVVSDVQRIAERMILGHLTELEQRYRLVQEQEEMQTYGIRLVRYKFIHVLYRNYLYNRLSRGERQVLHGEVATALEKHFQGHLDEMAARLAYHFFQANNLDHAFQYLKLAAECANRLYATDEAIQHYSQAIELVPRIFPNKAITASLYRNRGLAYETIGEFDRSRADHETVLQVARAGGESRIEWQAFLDLGRLWASRDYEQSRVFFDHALSLARQIGDPVTLANSLNWMANWYINAEHPQKAIEFHLEALAILEEIGDQLDLAKTLDLLGIATLLSGNYHTSLAYYDRAITLFRELNDRPNLASSLTGRGNICGAGYASLTLFPARKPKDAIPDFEEAICIANEIGLPASEVWTLWSLGFLFLVDGNFGRALEFTQNSLHTASEIGHREGVVGAQTVLGYLYLAMLAPREVLHQLEEALELATQLHSQHYIYQNTALLATAHQLLGDLMQAQSYLETVLSPQTPMDTASKRFCWVKQAELSLSQGNPLQALEIADRLIASTPGVPPGSVITFLWQLKGEALAATGNTDEAISLLCAAIENAQETGERFLLWRLHASLGRLYQTLDCQIEAKREISTASELIEEQAATIPDGKLRDNFLRCAYQKLTKPY